ncbi:MAG TPA: SDR family NAD(P)-dependent oxidoreductase, partial [Acidimicrobiales bacterium]|nr:SDR family NAD(P)-dependent oxidoreductase [Acidimicrobiales bacterium]
AVITGGASGIGRAVAEAAVAAGMKVVLADIEETALKEADAALGASGAEILSVITDVSVGSSVDELRDKALTRFGAVHLVHNNAGVAVGGPIWTVSEADWTWVMGVNLWGVIHGIRAFVPVLLEQGEGHVVNTASLAGLTSPGMLGPYNVTKHSVVTMSETLYRDLGAIGSRVGVSVLCPGFVHTRIAESDRNRPDWAPAASLPQGVEFQGVVRNLVAGGIEPTDVAEKVLYAVRHNRFYILTHDDTRAMVETRMRDILEDRNPSAAPIG